MRPSACEDAVIEDGIDEITLEPGALARVAPQMRRQLINRGSGRVLLLALEGSGEHEGRDRVAFASWKADSGAPPQETPLPADLDPSELRT